MKKRFDGKHFWLIGASTGIGRALAHELAQRGARLTLSARSLDKLESLREELGEPAQVAQLDVMDADAVEQVANSLEGLDGVVFLAATYNPDPGVERLEPELLYRTVNINLTGAMYVVEAVKPMLIAREGSVLALYASIAGYRGLPKGQPYSATKAGLINYAESLRTELHGKVLVKVINSGFVDTRITKKNKFHMPMLMRPEAAAVRIADGLSRRKFEISFPRRFACGAKLLRLLPNWLFFWVSRKL